MHDESFDLVGVSTNQINFIFVGGKMDVVCSEHYGIFVRFSMILCLLVTWNLIKQMSIAFAKQRYGRCVSFLRLCLFVLGIPLWLLAGFLNYESGDYGVLGWSNLWGIVICLIVEMLFTCIFDNVCDISCFLIDCLRCKSNHTRHENTRHNEYRILTAPELMEKAIKDRIEAQTENQSYTSIPEAFGLYSRTLKRILIAGLGCVMLGWIVMNVIGRSYCVVTTKTTQEASSSSGNTTEHWSYLMTPLQTTANNVHMYLNATKEERFEMTRAVSLLFADRISKIVETVHDIVTDADKIIDQEAQVTKQIEELEREHNKQLNDLQEKYRRVIEFSEVKSEKLREQSLTEEYKMIVNGMIDLDELQRISERLHKQSEELRQYTNGKLQLLLNMINVAKGYHVLTIEKLKKAHPLPYVQLYGAKTCQLVRWISSRVHMTYQVVFWPEKWNVNQKDTTQEPTHHQVKNQSIHVPSKGDGFVAEPMKVPERPVSSKEKATDPHRGSLLKEVEEYQKTLNGNRMTIEHIIEDTLARVEITKPSKDNDEKIQIK